MSRFIKHAIIVTTLCFMTSVGSVSAITVYRLNYQGHLTDAGGANVPDGAHTVTFSIYDSSTGGTTLWSSGTQTVTTTEGLFSYELGGNVFFPDNLFDNSIRFLGITVGTDPEMTPRSRLDSSPYALHAVKADVSGFADNADLLDGKNSTDFVAKSGDVMTGSLGFSNGSTPMNFIYQSGTSNSSRAIAAHSPAFPDWGFMYDDLNDEFVFTGSGDTNLVVKPFGSGDNAVRLGADAISSPEILDEPGIAQGFAGNIVSLNSTAMTDLITVTITIPKSGYIYLQGRTSVHFSGTTSQNIAQIQIDETSGGGTTNGQYTLIGLSSYSGIDLQAFNSTSQRTYFKTAGTHTFRLEGKLLTGSATAQASWPVLTATYYPGSYGSVQTVSPSSGNDPNAQTVQILDPAGKGNPTTMYQVDLRALELKARKAREESLRAELELERAQNRQENNR